MANTLQDPNRGNIDDRFARIEPIVGDALFTRRVAVIGRFGTARLVEYLTCCGVMQFDIISTDNDEKQKYADEECALTMLEQLRARLELDIASMSYTAESCHQALTNNKVSLFVGTGRRAEYELMRAAVEQNGKQGIFYRVAATGMGLIIFLLPGEPTSVPDWVFDEGELASDLFTELHLANVVANFAKGLLLSGTSYERTDIEELLASGVRMLMVGHQSWPWAVMPIEPSTEMPAALRVSKDPSFHNLTGRTCLIIGLGSLGSVIADTLNRLGANLVLIDGKEVATANPIRQIYGFDQVGEAKAHACVERLAYLQGGAWDEQTAESRWSWRRGRQWLVGCQAEITNEPEALAQLASLIAEYRPEVAVVATGTEHDRAISQLLRTAAVPHVVVSCYARARFFEAIVVDGKGGPCFGCVRGHLYLGSQPSLTPEQRARYVSSEHDLAAEPATRIETGRAADLAAHIAYGLLQPLSAHWLGRALDEEQTFFLGGNTVEAQPDGSRAYGIEWPGQVRLFGLQDISGRGSYLECWDCGRRLPVAVQYVV